MTGHAIRRAQERYGLDLDAKDMAGISGKIVDGHAVLLRRSDGGAKYLVHWAGVTLLAVWRGGNIVTFLPKEPETEASRKGRRRRRKCRT